MDTSTPTLTTNVHNTTNDAQSTMTDAADERYSLTVMLMTSLTLNFNILLLVVVKLIWMLIESCGPKYFKSLSHIKTDLAIIVSDELLNILLLGLTLYTCLTLEWPKAYLDRSNQPLSLICLVCVNLGRYIFRTGIIVYCRLFDKSSPILLIHHLMVILFLIAIVMTRYNWWYAVIGVFMEMNNMFGNMRQLIQIINKSYWKAVCVKFTMIQLTAKAMFRLALPLSLLMVYVFSEEVTVSNQTMGTVDIVTVWTGCTFFLSFQFYAMYIDIDYLYRKRKSVKRVGLSKVHVIPRPSNVSKHNPLLLNSAKYLPTAIPIQVGDLEKKLTVVKNDIKTPPVVFKNTSNVNNDHVGNNAKNCDKVLICNNIKNTN